VIVETVLCISKDFEWPTGVSDSEVAADFLAYYNEKMFYETVWLPRDVAEHSPQFLQVIPYVVLLSDNGVMRYRRTQKGGDERLWGKWSIGIGGHISFKDSEPGMLFRAVVNHGMFRELYEEWAFESFFLTSKPMYLIYDTSDAVSAVHIGLVYIAVVEGVVPVETDRHVDHGFVRLNEITDGEYEAWSRLLIAKMQK